MFSKYLTILLQMVRRKRQGIKNPTIYIGKGVKIYNPFRVVLDNNVRIENFVRIKGDVLIGAYSAIRCFTFLNAQEGSIIIGSNCSINDYTILYGMGDIVIGNDVRIAAHNIIVSSNHIFDNAEILIRKQGVKPLQIVIEDNVWVGANVCILGGCKIGTGSVIGAGSVVTRSIPPFSVAVGNPARVIRSRLK
jgi:acetyltransferase-like isoleucine patch superfamily enzyme